jgi:polyphenol oxidase
MNSSLRSDWLRPDWQAPGAGALMTTRHGGVSAAPFDSMNIRFGVGDDARAVQRNLVLLQQQVPAVPIFLNQVHGTRVVRLTAADLQANAPQHTADACITTERSIACTAQVADCLPLLFAAPGGVAAAHAGWRGLAGGVIEATVAALCEAVHCAPQQVHAWLGACIGPTQFEVGADVLAAFGMAVPTQSSRFVPRGESHPNKWLANLPRLARDRLEAVGVQQISGGTWCTATDASRFFSYRRDGVTGRMVAAVWRAD